MMEAEVASLSMSLHSSPNSRVIKARDTPRLPPVYSSILMRSPGILPRSSFITKWYATRSLMEPVGFSHSHLANTRPRLEALGISSRLVFPRLDSNSAMVSNANMRSAPGVTDEWNADEHCRACRQCNKVHKVHKVSFG